MATITTFLGIFYILFIIGMIVLYFNKTIKKDIWLQGIILMCLLTVLINMIPFIYYQTNFDIDTPLATDTIILDSMNLDNLNFTSQTDTDSKKFHMYRFENIDNKKINSYKKFDLCFYYNNTDDSNAVYIGSVDVDGVPYHSALPILVRNNTAGFECGNVDLDLVKAESWLGLHCDDCAPANTLDFSLDQNSINIIEMSVNDGVGSVSGSDLHFHRPHIFWLVGYTLPSELINKNFYRLLFFIGVFALIFIMRLIVYITKEGIDYG